MRVMALIPARGGSKGIPRKNLADLGGRPLIEWTIRAALACPRLERVIVSTDDEEIASVARACGAEVPFLRPAEFSGDTASAVEVIQHALTASLSTTGAAWDAVAYLQPTSPFRKEGQLDEALTLYEKSRPDTLVSVVAVPHNMAPEALMTPLERADGLLWFESPHGQVLRRQEKQRCYGRNGPALLIVSAQDVLNRGRLYGERVLGYEMDRMSSHDIDDPLDLALARQMLPLVQACTNP